MPTVYSFMIKLEEGKVIEIDREAEEVSIPPSATRICELACFFGSITSLDLENTNVIIIEEHAFANCYNLKEVRFSSCLEEICEGAFKQCKNLEHLSFSPDSRLLKIGKSSFRCCLKLKNFDFPHLVEFIGDYSFDGCDELLIIDLRETKVQHIGCNNFPNSTNVYLPSTIAPNEMICISESNKCHIEVDESHQFVQRDSCGYFFSNGTIFQWNKESRHVLIHRGVERIAGRCFYESNLVSVTIPSSVTEISDDSLHGCKSLQQIRFTKDSRLRVIGKYSFFGCLSIKKIHFPKSLKIIKEGAFECCKSLGQVVFSQIERIEGAFKHTAIKHLSLPPSVREIFDVSYGMLELVSMFVSNDLYQSNEEGSAIFSRDGSELVCVIKTLWQFEIPDCVRVIKKKVFNHSLTPGRLIIPPSVEVIEEEAFKYCNHLDIIEFKEGSRLRSLEFDALFRLRDLIINNENFVKMENGVVMSLNPRGIVFVPKNLTELDIPPGVEVIYSCAFYGSMFKSLKFPKSLKKICTFAFYFSKLESVTFEEGTELDFIGYRPFGDSNIKALKLPNIKGELNYHSFDFHFQASEFIEFPPNLCLRNKEIFIDTTNIVCPRSSLSVIAHFNYSNSCKNLIISDSLPQSIKT